MMARKNTKRKSTFCLEGSWENDFRKSESVRPLLEALGVNCSIPNIARDCATRKEFEYRVSKWTQRRYDSYPILYLASQGSRFMVCLGAYDCGLDDLANLLENKYEHRIIMFSSCKTMQGDKRIPKRFLQQTGALAVCGYQMEVDWMKSAAFELQLFSAMQDSELSGRGIGAIARRADEVAKMFKELEFRMVTVEDLT